MREIRFRAWDKQRKKMLAPDEGSRLDYQSAVGYAESIAIDWGITARGDFFFRELRGMTWPKNEFVLMQYTGLKDKNGVEIYEGDVVKAIANSYEYLNDAVVDAVVDVSGEVYWEECDASFMISGWDRTLGEVLQTQVIGNIYENPELLEKTS